MNIQTHSFMDGRVHVYKRDNSRYWQCSTYMNGRNHRVSTREESLALAKDVATQWYMSMYVDARSQRIDDRLALLMRKSNRYAPHDHAAPMASAKPKKETGPTFREAAEKFMGEYRVITQGQRNEAWAKDHERRIKTHLMSFFGDMPVSTINAGLVQEYRVKRQTDGYKGRKPSRSTLHHETVTLRLVLKTAHRYGWIPQVPDIAAPYKTSGKVKHRAWFSPEEYKALYNATRERAKNPPRERDRSVWEDFHDYVLFMANTGLRPDEAARLEYRDVTVVTDQDSGERLLEIEVRGKRGVGYCKSMTGAILPFQRMQKRHGGQPTQRIFGKTRPVLMNQVLSDLNLKNDRDGNVRTAYSLRHTYICLRLMEGADIYQIAKNCRTSVEMIEKFYAAHLKNTLDASAINVRKPKKRLEKQE
ncbi:MAG: site-specific integrase [Rhodospirillales bacterium]|nr:site-specific integrase [Alphaproteobacteria bacterium]MCB9986163.1 site-specific integrase [Rhodospirillales bacterium]USO07279.1 MAG: site-specific integrase [Rhodospirillales bacterium]